MLDFKENWVKYLPLVDLLITTAFKLALEWFLMKFFMGENVELHSIGMKWVNGSLVVKNS